MSKAVLILDRMPTSCQTCQLNSGKESEAFCDILDDWTETSRRDPDCPLRNFPEHVTEKQITPDDYGLGYLYGMKHGYNEALDDIGGDDDESDYCTG